MGARVGREREGQVRAMQETTPSGPSGATTDSPAAVVFDLDGTLLDTNYLHVMAWWEAFFAAGHDVSCFDVHRAIGKPSAELVQGLLGRPDDAVVQGHSRHWARVRDSARPFHRAAELQRACEARGASVVWATSGSPDDVAAAQRLLGVRDVLVVNSVEHGKPAPDIVQAALEAAGVPAARAVMVGDTVYDVRAAAAAGVPCIGLLCGGIGEQELREAGAAAVYGNPSELLDGLDASPVGQLLTSGANRSP